MCRVGRPGEMLLLKVMTYMRPKMHALLLDTTINSALTVRLNIFQAFLLAFMKMHWALRCLAPGRSGPAVRDPRLVLRSIQGCVNYTVGLVRSRVALARTRLRLDVRCSVSRCHIRWLGLKAARAVLTRKSSTYATVLEALDAQLALPGFAHVRQQLAPVVEPCRSSVFEQIIF